MNENELQTPKTTTSYVINITPMAVFGDKNGNAKGVLTLPSEVSKRLGYMGFDRTKSVDGEFIYADKTSQITITPKHKEKENPALQFTVNDPAQFKQLKIDGADSLVEGALGKKERKGRVYPSLECEISATKPTEEVNGKVRIRVIRSIPSPNEDRATELMRHFTENNKSFSAVANEENIIFESLSPWYDMESKSGDFKDVTQCIYILWGTAKKDITQKKLYVGIVGDTKSRGAAKRSLTQRLDEHKKQKTSITIEKFRFFELKNSSYSNIPELLRTLEMRIIQTLSVLIPQKGNRIVEPLVENGKVEIDGTLCTVELINLTYKHHE